MRLIDAETLVYAFVEKGQRSKRYHLGETWELNLSEILEVIESQPIANQWISVKDSLPQCGKKVIVRSYNGQIDLCSFYHIEEHDYWLPNLPDAIRRITQIDKLDWWMPIPEFRGDD